MTEFFKILTGLHKVDKRTWNAIENDTMVSKKVVGRGTLRLDAEELRESSKYKEVKEKIVQAVSKSSQ